jgi:hypothetical protein
MIPWPIALLSLFYAAIATLAGATTYQILTGAAQRQLLWQVLWLICAAGAALGLALLKPWGRTLAIWTSLALMAVLLAVAGLLAAPAQEPGLGLVVACTAGLQYLAVRYLRRPSVKAWFEA